MANPLLLHIGTAWGVQVNGTGELRVANNLSGFDEAPSIDTSEQRGQSNARDWDTRVDRDIRFTEENAGERPDANVVIGEFGIPAAQPNTQKPPGEGAAPDRGAFLRADALWSLWQTVDFWVALGQVSEAVAALRAYAREHPEGGAWPLLCWAALARQYGLAADEAAAGAAYTETFGHPMSMVALAPDAPGVADDPDFLSRLTHVWQGPLALSTVASALLAAPGAPDAKVQRSLFWYEDLLTPWAILRIRAQQPERGETRLTVAGSDCVAGESPSLGLVPNPEKVFAD